MPMFGDHTESHVFPQPHGEWVGPEDIAAGYGPYPGATAPDFFLPRVDGEYVVLENLRGKRVLLFSWGPWSPARAELGKLQKLYQTWQRSGLEVLAVAHDATGPQRASSLYADAKATFPLLMDRDNYLARLYSYKRSPTVTVIDELGIVRYRSVGGFSLDQGDIIRPLERFLSRPLTSVRPFPPKSVEDEIARMRIEADSIGDSYLDMDLGSFELQSGHPEDAISYYRRAIEGDHPWPWAARYGIGCALYAMGQRADAAAEWAAALQYDPENELIRLQLWSELYPERFYPEIDLAWQAEQRAAERRLGLLGANPAVAK